MKKLTKLSVEQFSPAELQGNKNWAQMAPQPNLFAPRPNMTNMFSPDQN